MMMATFLSILVTSSLISTTVVLAACIASSRANSIRIVPSEPTAQGHSFNSHKPGAVRLPLAA